MRLKLLLPQVEPDRYQEPAVCPLAGCGGRHWTMRQECGKPLRDTVYGEVVARRYECLRCGHTFRVYPVGVSQDRISARLKGLAVMLYIMGLSYGAVALVLQAMGHGLSKTTVYNTVQAAGARVPGLRREDVRLPLGRALVAALGGDLTSVKCGGEWLTVGVTTDAIGGTALTIDILEDGQAATLSEWVHDIAAAVHAEVLVSDDADGFKIAADDQGLAHQVCKAHVLRNSEEWVRQMRPLLAQDADGSLAALAVAPEQAVADCDALLRLMQERQPSCAAAAELAAIHRRYQAAPSPRQLGHDKETLAYRLRLFSLDRWNLWPRLTYYRHWHDASGATLDGTNNATERAIGWWIKERYRTMRGYKRRQSVRNVSRLIAWAGNHLHTPGADLTLVVA